MKGIAFILLVLLIMPAAFAVPMQLFNYEWTGNPVAPRGATQVQAGKVSATNVPLSNYDASGTINDCAAQGTLVFAHFDDAGSVSVQSTAGTSTASLSGGGGYGANGRVAGTGQFDPRIATVSWNIDNKGGGASKIQAGIDITYSSQPGYVWDGGTCTKLELTNIRASTVTPKRDTTISVWCESSVANAPGVTLTTNIPGIFVTPGGWTGSEQEFTFNVGANAAITVSCLMNNDATTAQNIVITPEAPAEVPNQITGLTVSQICTGVPSVKLTWTGLSTAMNYKVYEGDVLLSTKNTPKPDEMFHVVSSLTLDQSYIFLVRATSLAGQDGPLTPIAVNRLCSKPVRDLNIPPVSFQRAYFSRNGNREVTAYWDSDGAVFVYENFVYDFASTMPESAQMTLLKGYKQAMQIAASDVGTYWRQYTAALRVTPVVGAPFAGAVRGLQGYDSNKDIYTDNIVASSDYMILYGTFLSTGNEVIINGFKYLPDYQSSMQINVPLDGNPSGALRPSQTPASVQVSSSGMSTTIGRIPIS